MIIYGKVVDIETDGSDLYEQCENAETGEVEFITGYSCGSYEPTAAVLGIVLCSNSFLFSPTNIKDVRTAPTSEEKDLLTTVLKENGLSDENVGVFIFDESDD